MTRTRKLSALAAAVAATATVTMAASGTALAGPVSAVAAQRTALQTGLGPPPPPAPFTLASGTVNSGGLDTNTSFCYQPSPAPTSITNDPVNPACTPPPLDPPAVNPYDSARYPGWGLPIVGSGWVGAQPNGRDNSEAAPAWYIYDAEFTGCAQISGKVMADNEVGVFLDGVWLNDSHATSPHSFRRPPLTFSGVTTSNTVHVVDFVVHDLTRPATGLDYLVKGIPSKCTWTVKQGGKSKAVAKKAVLTDTATGVSVTCTSTALATFPSGGGRPGNSLGSISSLTLSGCNVLGLTGISGGPSDPVNAAIYNPSPSPAITSGTITGIDLGLSGTGCSAVVDGPSPPNNGQVDFTYRNPAPGTLTVLPSGGNLQFSSVAGCTGVFNNGDPATLSASYTLSPAPIITSP